MHHTASLKQCSRRLHSIRLQWQLYLKGTCAWVAPVHCCHVHRHHLAEAHLLQGRGCAALHKLEHWWLLCEASSAALDTSSGIGSSS